MKNLKNEKSVVILDVEAYQNAIGLITKIPYYLASPIIAKLAEAEKLGKDAGPTPRHITTEQTES